MKARSNSELHEDAVTAAPRARETTVAPANSQRQICAEGFPLCKRVVRVPPTTGSPASPCVPSCSAAQPPESQATQMDVESVSSEESFSMWNVPTTAGATSVSFLFWNHGSESSQSNPLDVSRSTAEDHGVQHSQEAAGRNAKDVNHLELSRRARLWNHKASMTLCGKLLFHILEMSVFHLVS